MNQQLLSTIFNQRLLERCGNYGDYENNGNDLRNMIHTANGRGFFPLLYPLVALLQPEKPRLIDIQVSLNRGTHSFEQAKRWTNNEYDASIPHFFYFECHRHYLNLSYNTDTIDNAINDEFARRGHVNIKKFLTEECVDVSATFGLTEKEARGFRAWYHQERKFLYIVRFSALENSESEKVQTKILLTLQMYTRLLEGLYTEQETKLIEDVYTAFIQNKQNIEAMQPLVDTLINKYVDVKEALRVPLGNLSEQLKRDRDSQINMQLNDANNMYNDMITKANAYSRKIRDLEVQRMFPIDLKTSFDSIINDITALNDIQYISTSRDGGNTYIDFDIITPLCIDESLLVGNNYLSRLAKLFYTALSENKIKVNIAQQIRIALVTTDGNNDRIVRVGAYPHNNNRDTIPNPHLHRFGCLGSNRHEIVKARDASNWYGVGMYCINTVGQLNLADSTVRSWFEDTYLRDNPSSTLPIILPNGTVTTWTNYKTELSRQEQEQLNGQTANNSAIF